MESTSPGKALVVTRSTLSQRERSVSNIAYFSTASKANAFLVSSRQQYRPLVTQTPMDRNANHSISGRLVVNCGQINPKAHTAARIDLAILNRSYPLFDLSLLGFAISSYHSPTIFFSLLILLCVHACFLALVHERNLTR